MNHASSPLQLDAWGLRTVQEGIVLEQFIFTLAGAVIRLKTYYSMPSFDGEFPDFEDLKK